MTTKKPLALDPHAMRWTVEALDRAMGPRVTLPPPRMVRRG